MYRIGTPEEVWNCREEFPEVFFEPFKRAALKPLGHAVALRMARDMAAGMDRPLRVLEIGHGSQSPFFDIADTMPAFECHGIDADDKDKTVALAALEKLRKSYTNARFYNGYIGGDRDSLPENYFDFVFSISVIEHVPPEDLPTFHEDLATLLAPGGVQFHSYDRPWKGDVVAMHEAVEGAGFQWLEPRVDPASVWETASANVGVIAFEDPFIVTEYYMHKYPREGRRLYNWCSLLMGARKP